MRTELQSIDELKKPSKQLARSYGGSPFSSVESFEAAQRMAAALNSSTMIPSQYQGRENVGNALIAMEVAHRNGSSVFAVMQELYIVHNRPSWSSKYLIATINQSGLFTDPLLFEFRGDEGTDGRGCRGVTTLLSGRVAEGPWVDIAMAKLEGWYGRRGSKWQTLPDLMLRYRAASFFCNTICPELALGMKTTEEAQDIIDFNPDTGEVIVPDKKDKPVKTADLGGKEEDTVGDVIEGESKVIDTASDAEAVADIQKEIDDVGYSTIVNPDGSKKWFTVRGEQWDAVKHGLSSATKCPVVNQDGSFKAKRGYVAPTKEEVAAAEAKARLEAESDAKVDKAADDEPNSAGDPAQLADTNYDLD